LNFPNLLGPSLFASFVAADRLPSWSTDFRLACRTRAQFVDTAARFCHQHPRRCLTVRTADLQADPHQGFERMLAFLGTNAEQTPADYFAANRLNSSFPGTPAGDSPIPHQVWSNWTSEQQRMFNEEAGQTMVRFGLASTTETGLPDVAPPTGPDRESQVAPDSSSRIAVFSGAALPLTGPVRQMEQAIGLWPDSWVGKELRSTVEIQEKVDFVTITGTFPHDFGHPVGVSLRLGEVTVTKRFGLGTFRWEVPNRWPMGATLELHLVVDRTWSPFASGASNDDRWLSFRIESIAFASS